MFVKTYCNSFYYCERSKLLASFVITSKRNVTSTSTESGESLVIEDNISQEIEKKRDKSMLKPQHRNILFDKKPYSEPMIKSHLTVKYNRRMFGKYGMESGVDPGIMWPTKEDLEMRREYERVAYPFTIQEMVKAAIHELGIKEQEEQEMQERVASNLQKLDTWKKELKEKIAKKEAEVMAAKQKKEKLIEEVRRHVGFTVDPKDERFKEMLAAKEKEQKKRDKQIRMEERERKSIEKLMTQHEASITGTNASNESS